MTVGPASGSSGGVRVSTHGDDTYVVPEEAAGLPAAGRLDKRLFDVTRLVALGSPTGRTARTRCRRP
ncbi:hypothetical protein [Streptomyces sp. NPDC058664]|uniref:hypothetical protein n=1 Tax=unclassified Streptomyces TaxID=2593676 RepID=UPI003647AAD3